MQADLQKIKPRFAIASQSVGCFCIIIVAVVIAGCARSRPPVGPPFGSVSTNSIIVKPSAVTPGRVDWVNPKARHIIASFPVGAVPSVDTRLNVYRNGLKVAEVKVSLPQQNNLSAADIINGECQVGDEVRTY